MNTIDRNAGTVTIDVEYVGRDEESFDEVWEDMKKKGRVVDKSNRTLHEEKLKAAEDEKYSNPNYIINTGYKITVSGHDMEVKKNPDKNSMDLYKDGQIMFN